MKVYELALAPESSEDLDELLEYITTKSSRAIAERYIRGIVAEATSLAHAPNRGQSRSDLRDGLRTIGYKRSVTIVFRIVEARRRVEIVSFLYRGRRPAEAFRYEARNERFNEF